MVNFRNNTKSIINLEYSTEKISDLKKKEREYKADTILYEKFKMPPMPKTTIMTTGSIYIIY